MKVIWPILLKFFKLTPFKVGIGVMAVTAFLGHLYYEEVELRRPESAEADKRKVHRTFQEHLTDVVTLIHHKTIDFRLKLRGLKSGDDRVIIVAADEESVNKIGRWPWPRSRMADAIHKLMAYDTKVYGYDAVFSEEETNQAFKSLERLQDEVRKSNIHSRVIQVVEEEMKAANTDWKFAQAVQMHSDKLVLGSFYGNYAEPDIFDPQAERKTTGERWELLEKLQIPIILDKDESQKNVPLTVRIDGFVTNIKPLLQASTYQGYFNALPDADGVIRRSPVIASFGGTFFPSLALQMAALALDGSITLTVKNYDSVGVKVVDSLSINSQETGDPIIQVPVDHKGLLMINYGGPRYMFPHLGIHELFSDRDEATIQITDPATGLWGPRTIKKSEYLRNKVVIFGATAIGIFDLRNTPFDENYPGVETHANLISNIITQDFLQPIPSRVIEIFGYRKLINEAHIVIFSLIVLGLILAFVVGTVGAVPGALVTLGGLAALLFIDKYFIFGKGYVFTIVLPFFQIGAMYVAVTFYKYLTEERNKKQIKSTFEKYVSPEVVKQILHDPSKIALGGEKKKMTVMFSDVRGFTTLSEKMEATQLGDFLNSYLTPMTDLVFQTRGTLDKYMGDAIMAFWGAPVTLPGHAKYAARCALLMLEKLEELKTSWAKRGLPPIDIGIGINTGEMSVGNMGSNTVRSYTVMGDAVNLGSRLEGINKDYGTHIIVSEYTYEEIKNEFICREVDWVRVKGKEQPVKIYELICEKGKEQKSQPILKHFNDGYVFFREKKFNEALAEFQKAVALRPDDGPSKEFVERCEGYISEPPPADWNGVVIKKTK